MVVLRVAPHKLLPAWILDIQVVFLAIRAVAAQNRLPNFLVALPIFVQGFSTGRPILLLDDLRRQGARTSSCSCTRPTRRINSVVVSASTRVVVFVSLNLFLLYLDPLLLQLLLLLIL